MVLLHNDLNVTTVASSGGSIRGRRCGRSPPLKVRVVSEEFFGNQFSQFVVVIFLFQGFRNSSPITNFSPQDC